MPARLGMDVLLIDDDEDDYILTRDLLSDSPDWDGQLTWASSFEEGRRLLSSERYDAILVDNILGERRGLDLISEATERHDAAPFILLTGLGSSQVDFDAVKAGATLYLTKHDISPALLVRSIQYAIERRQAEQAQAELLQQLRTAMREVEKSRSELEAIFSSQIDVVLIYDPDMRVRRANRVFQDHYGFDPTGLHVQEIIRGVNCRSLDGAPLTFEDQPTPRALRGEKVTGASYLVTKADGSKAAVATSSGPVYLDGRITGTITVWHDITERVQSELALRESEARLRESEQRFRVSLSSSQMFVFSMDRDLRYTWVHSSGEDEPMDLMLGKRDDEIWPGSSAEEVTSLKQSVIDTGQAVQKEIKIRTDQDCSWYIFNLDPDFDEAGQVCGLIGAALNVTELRSLEEENKERATRLEIQRRLTEYREKERMELARDLHDGPIQTILSALMSINYALEASHEPELVEELETVGLRLQVAEEEIRNMIYQLRPPSLTHFGLSKAIKAHAERFLNTNARVQLCLDLPDEEDNLSEYTRLTLFRIFQEAFSNTLRHAHASQIDIHFTHAPAQAILHIRDNGQGFALPCGIDTLVQNGHYGLASMRERAEAIGGEIHILSNPGEGTSVSVDVPIG